MVLTQENVEGKLEEVDLTEKGSRPCPKSKKLLHENLSKKRYNWYDRAFPGSGHQTPQEEEIRHLKRELEVTRQERDILKKALGIFSRNQL